jgi:hypothetical protein
VPLVGLEAALHQGREAARRDRLPGREVEGREGERRRSGEVARHQEAPRRRRRDGLRAGAQRRQIGLEGVARGLGPDLVGGALRVERREAREPRRRDGLPAGVPARRDGLARPVRVGGVDQREVEEPLARVVDDVDREARRPGAPPGLALEIDVEPQFADPARALRPAPVADQRRRVLLEGKARHVVVGLVRQHGAPDAPLRGGPEGRQRGALREMVDERRREHGLARPGKARDADPQGRLHELAGGLPERLRGGAGAGGEAGDERHGGPAGAR